MPPLTLAPCGAPFGLRSKISKDLTTTVGRSRLRWAANWQVLVLIEKFLRLLRPPFAKIVTVNFVSGSTLHAFRYASSMFRFGLMPNGLRLAKKVFLYKEFLFLFLLVSIVFFIEQSGLNQNPLFIALFINNWLTLKLLVYFSTNCQFMPLYQVRWQWV